MQLLTNMTTSTPRAPILLLGGTGKVSSRLAGILSSASIPVLTASRSGKPPFVAPGVQAVVFDWLDDATYGAPFDHPSAVEAGGIQEVFIVAPPIMDQAPPLKAFIDLAKAKGVRRFVLLSASPLEAGGPAMGQAHAYLRDLGVEWAVLRPTWFMENFTTQERHTSSIRDDSAIYSATEDGRIPWVSADDIAAAAMATLTIPEPPNTDYLILGSELLSYDDVALILTDVIGKQIVHQRVAPAELETRLQSFGMPPDYSQMMSAMDISVKHGTEERSSDSVLALTGKKPKLLRDWAEASKSAWL